MGDDRLRRDPRTPAAQKRVRQRRHVLRPVRDGDRADRRGNARTGNGPDHGTEADLPPAELAAGRKRPGRRIRKHDLFGPGGADRRNLLALGGYGRRPVRDRQRRDDRRGGLRHVPVHDHRPAAEQARGHAAERSPEGDGGSHRPGRHEGHDGHAGTDGRDRHQGRADHLRHDARRVPDRDGLQFTGQHLPERPQQAARRRGNGERLCLRMLEDPALLRRVAVFPAGHGPVGRGGRRKRGGDPRDRAGQDRRRRHGHHAGFRRAGRTALQPDGHDLRLGRPGHPAGKPRAGDLGRLSDRLDAGQQDLHDPRRRGVEDDRGRPGAGKRPAGGLGEKRGRLGELYALGMGVSGGKLRRIQVHGFPSEPYAHHPGEGRAGRQHEQLPQEKPYIRHGGRRAAEQPARDH